MLVFKKEKLVECSQEEFEQIEHLYKRSSCFAVACDILYCRMVEFKIDFKAEKRIFTTTQIKDMAHNALMAVAHKYKYLKVV